MTILSMVQNACRIMDLESPSTVIGNTSQSHVAVLLGLANQEGKELARRAAWSILTKIQTFTSLASEEQTGMLPSDFDRMIPETFYNRTRKRQVLGPLSAQEWEAQKAITATVLYDSFRIRGGAVQMIPTPVAGMTYAFEYVSSKWCQNSGGDTQYTEWTADTNVGLLDEELMKLGLLWRFRQSKGLDYAESFRTYETQVEQAISRDGGRRVINMSNRTLYDRPRYPGVTEGSWSL